MNYTVKLLIPVALGVAAAVLNWITLTSGSQPVEFVTVTREIEAGAMFDPASLAQLKVDARFDKLKDAAPLYKDKGVLSGQIARRALAPGDIVFYRDTLLRGVQLDLLDDEIALAVPLGKNSQPPGLLRVGMMVSFKISMPGGQPGQLENKWVGPFRLVAVDATMTQGVGVKLGHRAVEQVLVAVKRQPTEQDRLLDDYCDRQQTGEAESPRLRIDDSGI